MRKPELFKMACLRDIQRLFGGGSRNAFYAGFGNRITDAMSYRSVNVPSSRIFTIDSHGELLELAGYKSSYIHMVSIVTCIVRGLSLTPCSADRSGRSDVSPSASEGYTRIHRFQLLETHDTGHSNPRSVPSTTRLACFERHLRCIRQD
jgi:phosphatidate phosphatase PAH1